MGSISQPVSSTTCFPAFCHPETRRVNILACLRPENTILAAALVERGHSLWVAPRELMIRMRQMGICAQPIYCDDAGDVAIAELSGKTRSMLSEAPDGPAKDCILNRLEDVTEMVWSVQHLHEQEGLDAVLVWTDAPSQQRAAVLAAKVLGIPTFEITHGALNTYRQGHFECESHVDYILAPGQEEADFRAFYGNKAEVIVTGKPTFDWIVRCDGYHEKIAIREQLGIPFNRPIVLYGMTWRHPFSTWERDFDLGESTVLEAHMNLQASCKPYLVIKPHYIRSNREECENITRWCESNGMVEYGVTSLDPRAILPAVDLVVSHKSSLLVEAVLMDIPAVGFDFRERNDFAFYQGRGIEWVSSRGSLLPAMARCLLDAPTRSRLSLERESAKHYFNGPNDGKAIERCIDAIEEKILIRRAA